MLHSIARSFAVFVLALVVSVPAADAVTYTDLPPEMEEMASWAVGLFDQAGLALPAIEYVHYGGDHTACSGRDGSQRTTDGGSVIFICTTEVGFATQVMILHETAHAWSAYSLTEEVRANFKTLRGWTYWRDYDKAAWHENGTEQAAEIMVWGLIDRPIGMARIYQNSCEELYIGYVMLTGQSPLHGYNRLLRNRVSRCRALVVRPWQRLWLGIRACKTLGESAPSSTAFVERVTSNLSYVLGVLEKEAPRRRS